MTPLLAGALAALFISVGLLGVPMLLDRGPLERLAGRAGGAPARRSSLTARVVGGLAGQLGPRVAPSIRTRQRERIAHRLDLAGRPGGVTVQRFIGLKAALATLLGGVVALLVLAGSSPLLLPLAIAVGWFGPDLWLAREARLRQERIERDLPDFLDILAVTVRAGLGYRAALGRVAEALGGPIADEMLTALRQMELGASRRQAFLALRERSASESLGTFIAAQLQAEELGVPLSQALNDIAEDMRRTAHQNARRRASRAAPRVSLIVTTMIVPGAMILILVSILLGSDLSESGLLGG
ncbi:MAG TPA: type II secretion system F family protein [Solirubrobacteraceae bacterium]|nr:type II secretion system F family protein [Solirubrobacteraceae bacterium]